MAYKPNDYVQLSWQHTPRAISQYKVVVLKHDNLQPFEALFGLSCSCGEKTLRILGIEDDELVAYPPISTICSACGREQVLLDLQQHGYGIEIGEGSAGYPVRSEPATPLSCSGCGKGLFYTKIRYTYQFDESVADFIGTDDIKEALRGLVWVKKCARTRFEPGNYGMGTVVRSPGDLA